MAGALQACKSGTHVDVAVDMARETVFSRLG